MSGGCDYIVMSSRTFEFQTKFPAIKIGQHCRHTPHNPTPKSQIIDFKAQISEVVYESRSTKDGVGAKPLRNKQVRLLLQWQKLPLNKLPQLWQEPLLQIQKLPRN